MERHLILSPSSAASLFLSLEPVIFIRLMAVLEHLTTRSLDARVYPGKCDLEPQTEDGYLIDQP